MSNKGATFFLIIAVILLFTPPSFCLGQERMGVIEAIVFDIHDGRILAAQSEKGFMVYRSVGSLAKPLVSYALLVAGKSDNNVYFCRASSSEEKSTKSCWYKPGHGNLTFSSALANSCNAWFRQWLDGADDAAVISFFDELGIVEPAELASTSQPAVAISGLEENLSFSTLNCAAGFASLFNGGILFAVHADGQDAKLIPVGTMKLDSDAVQKIAEGMRECGAVGTGSAFGDILGPGSALVKTGTTYAETPGGIDTSQTDGWCIALYPAERPRLLVLLRFPGGSGAQAAGEAATFLNKVLVKDR